MQDLKIHSAESTAIMPCVNGRTTVMRNQHLHDVFIDGLKDIYDAETQLLKALPQMEAAATSSALKECFSNHLRETQQQVKRLELAFENIDQPVESKTCAAMNSLMEEVQIALQKKSALTRDAAIIAAAQKVEHYEIASYGTLKNWAQLMGHHTAANLLEQNLQEEKMADRSLMQKARANSEPSTAAQASADV